MRIDQQKLWRPLCVGIVIPSLFSSVNNEQNTRTKRGDSVKHGDKNGCHFLVYGPVILHQHSSFLPSIVRNKQLDFNCGFPMRANEDISAEQRKDVTHVYVLVVPIDIPI